jgi:hypothetical protein
MLQHQLMLKNNRLKKENSTGRHLPLKVLFLGVMKYFILSFVLFTGIILLYSQPAMACKACSQQQPKLLQGITHGPGPDSNWDYLIVGVMVFITLYTLYATIKCILRPAEKTSSHIKRMILNQ